MTGDLGITKLKRGGGERGVQIRFKENSTVRMITHWNRLPSEVVDVHACLRDGWTMPSIACFTF